MSTTLELAPAELLVLVGPTASGKSDLALRWAEQHDGEIISTDSVQVYRHFDIGSGKPTPAEQARVRHHLIDTYDPLDAVDAMRFADDAHRAILDVRARGKLPIVCGGTFLYVRALVYGLLPAPPASPEIRARHAAWEKEHGRAYLHDRLREVDPESAARLSPNDFVRVSRALEVFETAGLPLSHMQKAHGFRSVRHQAKLVGIQFSKEALAERIATRTQRFLDAGWVEEVRALVARGYREARAMTSVGYRQVLAHVEGAAEAVPLADTVNQATRVFARRQRTWLRDEPVHWVLPEDAASVELRLL